MGLHEAFNAPLFVFRHVLGKEFGEVEGVVRAKKRLYVLVVLSRGGGIGWSSASRRPSTCPRSSCTDAACGSSSARSCGCKMSI